MPTCVDYSMTIRAEQCKVIETSLLARFEGMQRADVVHINQALSCTSICSLEIESTCLASQLAVLGQSLLLLVLNELAATLPSTVESRDNLSLCGFVNIRLINLV